MKNLNFRIDNRKITRKHVEEIKESIKAHGFLSYNPIIINENNEIIDGQHRYIACCELGIEPPIIVAKDADPSLMVDLNRSQKTWGIGDFVNYHAETGKISYILLRDSAQKTKIAITPSILILTDENGFTGFDDLKAGDFRVELSQEEYRSKVKIAEEINIIAKLLRLSKGNKIITQAYLALLKIEDFDKTYFFNKIRRHREDLSLCGSLKNYLQMFITIYNYNKRSGKISA